MTRDQTSQAVLPVICASRELAGMELLIVSHGFQMNYERGFCNGLAQAGAHVTLISSDQTDYHGLHPKVRTLNLRGSQIASRGPAAKIANLLRYHFMLCAHALRKRAGVLHVIGLLDPPFLLGVIEGLWFRLVSRRYVMTVHNLLPHDSHTLRNRVAYAISYQLANRLVVHTQRMKDDLSHSYRIPREKIVVMEHGIEPPIAASSAGSLGGGPVLRLLFFGLVTRYKGVDLLLEALNGLSVPFTLTIAGFSRNAALIAELQDRIRNHSAAGSITWLNSYIPEHQVESLFANADVLVLPYRHIDQSGVLFQALRHGLPVVATRVGAFQDYVSDEIGETCVPDDPAELCAAIVRLKRRLHTMSRAQIALIGKQFEWPQTVQALHPAYGSSDTPWIRLTKSS